MPHIGISLLESFISSYVVHSLLQDSLEFLLDGAFNRQSVFVIQLEHYLGYKAKDEGSGRIMKYQTCKQI